jgi:hypothetical protein
MAPVLKVVVHTAFDTHVGVSVKGARPEGRGLPAVCCASKSPAEATYVGTADLATGTSKGSKGTVEVDGFEQPVIFHVAPASGIGGHMPSFVGEKGKFKHTAMQAVSWDWRGCGPKPTEGRAMDVELVSGAEVRVTIRPQTKVELQRCLQLKALREAAEDNDYDSLRAQVTKARMASVDAEHLAKGEARLKELKGLGLHINEGCDRATIRESMDWLRVTHGEGAADVNEPCTACEDCSCNVAQNPGEELEFIDGAVQDCLKEFSTCGDGDKQLFKGLVDAALAVEEGCIWKAGGKFIFSEFSRNQSATALGRMLCNVGQQHCAKMVQTLQKLTESKYAGYVTAIQINFHPHKGTYHDQHRDIYSVKQAAGANCTCQFQDCVGTVCYSIGSSRRVLLETMTDTLSSIKPCGEGCQGRREWRWLHSGSSMYFNCAWNDNHTHGIPPSEEECGPRISLAFLLAKAKPFVFSSAR